MKKFLTLAMGAICALLAWSATAQNPNWTMPGWYFNPDVISYDPLPQSPNGVFDPLWAYQGEEGAYSSAGYTGPDGELLLFTVDDKVYDKNGWVVGRMRAVPGNDEIYTRQGYCEVLILPMGNYECKYANFKTLHPDFTDFYFQI